ncbi:hypothetical protein ACM55H_16605 [Flavobacterium sp. ZT3R17]|uniref:hypothetical protein n=1 Tax=Flavobacterium cryoconiti TaxID=3398736 RepID=UPI003A863E7F
MMKAQTNKGLWIGDFIQNQKDNKTHTYNAIKRNIDDNGYFGISIKPNPPVKIYTTELGLLLMTGEIPQHGINTFDYIKSYTESYNKGIKFFQDNFLPNVNILYGANAELYVKDIHNNYFHTDHGNGVEGWNHIKNHYPVTLSHEIINEFGYYAGIVSEVDKMVDSYFELFQKLDKGCCEDITTDEKLADKLTLKQLALKLVYEGKDVTRNNSKDFLINTNLNSGDKLYNEFTFYRSTTDRKANPQSKVKLEHKIKLFEIVIDLLDDKFKPKAQDELKILKSYLVEY